MVLYQKPIGISLVVIKPGSGMKTLFYYLKTKVILSLFFLSFIAHFSNVSSNLHYVVECLVLLAHCFQILFLVGMLGLLEHMQREWRAKIFVIVFAIHQLACWNSNPWNQITPVTSALGWLLSAEAFDSDLFVLHASYIVFSGRWDARADCN